MDSWLSSDRWKIGDQPVNWEGLKGRRCFGGLDLSSTTDVTSLCLVFPPRSFDPAAALSSLTQPVEGQEDMADWDEAPPLDLADDPWVVLWRFYLPKSNLGDREERDRVAYRQWAADGHITLTPGNVVDFDFIRRDVARLNEDFDIQSIAIDRWQATHLTTQLMADGFNVLGFGQGFASMSAPSKFLEKLVYGGEIQHGGNPVSAWMCGNTVVQEDAARNYKPVKRISTGRIDGIVALIMGIGVALTPVEESGPSFWESL